MGNIKIATVTIGAKHGVYFKLDDYSYPYTDQKGEGWYVDNLKVEQVPIVYITGGTDATNTNLIAWFGANGTLTPPATGYSITYHSDGGTPIPDNLTGQTALPDPLPTISKSNYIFNGWYLDSTFETPAVAGATISANTDLYAKFTEDTRIHCDLTQLEGWADLAAGQHTITVKAKASGYRDSEPSTGVTVTKAAAYQYTQEGSVVTLLNAPYSQTGSEVTIL